MSEPKKIDLLFYIYLIFLTIISNNNIMIYEDKYDRQIIQN